MVRSAWWKDQIGKAKILTCNLFSYLANLRRKIMFDWYQQQTGSAHDPGLVLEEKQRRSGLARAAVIHFSCLPIVPEERSRSKKRQEGRS